MAGIVLDFLPGGTARHDPNNEMTRSKAATEKVSAATGKVSAAPMQGLWSADTTVGMPTSAPGC
jgi:hypothetical protein